MRSPAGHRVELDLLYLDNRYVHFNGFGNEDNYRAFAFTALYEQLVHCPARSKELADGISAYNETFVDFFIFFC